MSPASRVPSVPRPVLTTVCCCRVKPYTEFVSFNGISANTDSLLSGTAQNASVTSNVTGRFPIYHNFAFYYQHAYKSRSYTTLTYGIRRDLNPAPGVRSGPHMPGLDSSQNLSSSEPLYHTRWINIAPRFGLATELTHAPKPELVFRGGIGVFSIPAAGQRRVSSIIRPTRIRW